MLTIHYVHPIRGSSKVFQDIPHVVSRGVWGHAYLEDLDASRSLLRPFLAPKSHNVLQFLENRISIVATHTPCEV